MAEEISINQKVPDGTPLYRPARNLVGSGEDEAENPLVILKLDDNPIIGWSPDTARSIAKNLLQEAERLDGIKTMVIERDA